jgi:hypothetical protein
MTTSHTHKFLDSEGWPVAGDDIPCAECGRTWTQITAPVAKVIKDRDMTASSVENRKSDARFAASVRHRAR